MKFKLLILLLLTEGPFLTLGSGLCRRDTMYPYGAARGDLQQIHGHESSFAIETSVHFLAFGNTYHKIIVNTNGAISFDSDVKALYPPQQPIHTQYAAVYWADVLLSGRIGRIYFRKVNISEEQDVVAMIERDSAAIGEAITPELAVVITWYRVCHAFGDPNKENTFQVVFASQGGKTIIVFNYGDIQWMAMPGFYFAGIRIENSEGQLLTYPIDSTPEMINIMKYSTIGVPGRIVNRIDGNYPLLPLVEPRCKQCTIDRYNGSVITFDGSTEMVTNATNRKYLISKVYQADAGNRTDQCKYMLRAATDENGQINWVAFSVGVHPRNPAKYKRNFAFERHIKDTVLARGHHMKMMIDHFPYTERIDDNGQNLDIIIEKTAVGWIVRSPTCPYVMEYSPGSGEYQLMLYLGEYYKGKTIGICQNFNDDAADDSLDCSSPPQIADVSAIGQSCSCPITQKACNKWLKKL